MAIQKQRQRFLRGKWLGKAMPYETGIWIGAVWHDKCRDLALLRYQYIGFDMNSSVLTLRQPRDFSLGGGETFTWTSLTSVCVAWRCWGGGMGRLMPSNSIANT